MNTTPTALAALCAALLSGCSSAPSLPVPSGDWEDFVQQPLALSTSPPATPAAIQVPPYRPSYSQDISLSHPAPGAPAPSPAVTHAAVERPALTVSTAPAKPVAVTMTSAATAPLGSGAKAVPVPPKPTVASSTKPPAPIAPPVSASKPSAASTTKPVPPASLTAVAKATPVVTPKPVVVTPPPPTTWRVSPEDKTIRETLAKWAKADGWTFNPLGRDYWTVDKDFDVVASDTFTGPFKDAVRQLIASTELTSTPLQPCFYSNRAVRVVPINQECASQAQPRQLP